MNDLLTTKQLQDMLQVDRTTIYRMLDDGRLTGFKVGSQWRFSRSHIENWLDEQRVTLNATTESSSTGEDVVPSAEVLPLQCIQAIQDVFAQALDVGAVTADLDGQALTEMSNSCQFCHLITSSPTGQQRCIASRRALAAQWEPTPLLSHCHAGLLCARGRIEIGDELVAIVYVGEFLTEPLSDGEWAPRVAKLAATCEVDEAVLLAATDTVRILDRTRAEQLTRLLQTVADTFSHIGQERLDLLNRLKRIAEITAIVG